jgi:hypothetical protein
MWEIELIARPSYYLFSSKKKPWVVQSVLESYFSTFSALKKRFLA